VPEDSLIDRHFLEKLERLAIRWQRSFPGLVGGHNVSRFSGAGQEFLDHRHFHQGDDLRAVNWRAYMRLEKLFLKMFQVEPRVPVRLLLDTSRSMETGNPRKFDYARQLAAALSYVALVRLDTVTIHPFGERFGESFRCAGGRHRIGPAVDFLTRLEMSTRTSFNDLSRQFISAYSQRGLVILISDFLDDGDVERPLQYLADFGHELLLVHLWADEDRMPPWDGELELTDVESGQQLELSFDDEARLRYTAAFDEYARRLQSLAYRAGGRYAGFSTSLSLEDAVFGSLMRAQGVA